MVKVGIIGGTGCGGFSLENLKSLEGRETVNMGTIWGDPSDLLTTGTLHGVPVVLLGRHGPGHKFNPTHVPYKANIQALKEMGCSHIIATSACGSLKEEMAPGHVVLIDQFIDWTTKRSSTFFDSTLPPSNATRIENEFFSKVTHVSTADPFCERTRNVLARACREVVDENKFHTSGAMITIEGPRLSTRAESKMFRLLGADLINMTTSPEASLAKEAGLCYATIATVTDYDSWRTEGEKVTVKMVIENARKNQDIVFDIVCNAVKKIAAEKWEDVLEKLSQEVNSAQM